MHEPGPNKRDKNGTCGVTSFTRHSSARYVRMMSIAQLSSTRTLRDVEYARNIPSE